MIVVNTQVIVYHFLPGQFTELTNELFLKDPQWLTSHLWRYEFRNVIAEYIRKKLVSSINAIRIAEEAELFFLNREISAQPAKVVELIERSKCTAYDLEFVAIAEEIGAPLITTDKEILKAFPKISYSIKDYLREKDPT